jgi:hypothetical protein
MDVSFLSKDSGEFVASCLFCTDLKLFRKFGGFVFHGIEHVGRNVVFNSQVFKFPMFLNQNVQVIFESDFIDSEHMKYLGIWRR